MTPEEHKEKHIKLHNSLDELFADFIKQHPDTVRFLEKPIIELIRWSKNQTCQPTECKP